MLGSIALGGVISLNHYIILKYILNVLRHFINQIVKFYHAFIQKSNRI